IVAASAMVLIPVLYLLLIALLVYNVFSHSAQLIMLFNSASSNFAGVPSALLSHLAFIFLGIILVFSLTKPFFAQTQDETVGIPLQAADAPRFFALLDWICKSLRAP